jgi:predicted Zn-dependent protease
MRQLTHRRFIPCRDALARLACRAVLGLGCCAAGSTAACNNVGISNVVGLVQSGQTAIQSGQLNEADEPKLGESFVCAITTQYPLSTDEALNKYVTLVGLTAATGIPRNNIPFCFGVLETPTVNAFSGPGGYVLVTRGALNKIEDEAELAGVLAHEMGHIVLHHGLEATKKAMLTESGKQALANVNPNDAFGILADLSTELAKKPWEKAQEFAADNEAVHYLVAAGYDPASYERFLGKLGTGGGTLMSTHPATADRIAAVRTMVDDLAARGQGQTLKSRFTKNVKRG